MFITCELMNGPQRCKRLQWVYPTRGKDNCQRRSYQLLTTSMPTLVRTFTLTFLQFVFLTNWESLDGSSLSLQTFVSQKIFLATDTLKISTNLETSQERLVLLVNRSVSQSFTFFPCFSWLN